MTAYDNSDLDVLAGDPIRAADVNDIIDRLGRIYIKSSPTARISTTTLTDDPELASIPLAVGTYEIELVGYFTLTTTATQKIKTRWAFTGTWNGTAAARNCIGPGSAQTAAPANVTETSLLAVSVSNADSVYDVAAGTAYASFRELAGEITVSASGNLSLTWAQNASSANATTLQERSYFRVRKIA